MSGQTTGRGSLEGTVDSAPEDRDILGLDGIALAGRLERIGRLAALARGLEREGGYNGAKLVRAALDRELLLLADVRAPVGHQALGDAVATIRRELAADYPDAFLACLGAVETAARQGATVPLDAAPPTRTCRVCGELFLGDDVPTACPTCGAPAISFREHLPIWFLEPAEPGTMLAVLATGPDRIAAALSGHDETGLARPPAPGAWSVRESLEHVLFAEQLFAERVGRLLTEDEPDLAARAVWSQTRASDEGTVRTGEPAGVIFDRYRELRHGTVDRLRNLAEAQWGQGGHHAEWGHVTVLSQAAYFARHEASHLAQIVAAAEGRTPGRRA
jgi:hypothetical protein